MTAYSLIGITELPRGDQWWWSWCKSVKLDKLGPGLCGTLQIEGDKLVSVHIACSALTTPGTLAPPCLD